MTQLYTIFRKSPVLRVLLFFTIGLLLANRIKVGSGGANLALAFTMLLSFLSWYLNYTVYQYKEFSDWIVWCTVLLVGLAYSTSYNARYSSPYLNKEGVIIGKVISVPVTKRNRQEFVLKVDKLNAEDGIHKVLVKYYDTVPLTIKSGFVIALNANLKPVTNLGNPGEFDYSGYLARKHIFSQTFIKKRTDIYVADSTADLRSHAALFSQFLSLRLASDVFDPDNTKILNAMLLGRKYELSDDIRETFIDAGIIHILAVSGLHVGMIYLLVLMLLKLIPDKNKLIVVLKLLLATALIWGYAFITGFSVSVVRASIMFTVFLVSKVSLLKTHSMNSLAFSAMIILLINPNEIYSVGFQFSFLAVGGILMFYPVLSKLVSFSGFIPQKIWEMFVITFSAQLLLIPLQIYYFHLFTPVSFITNLFAIPFASVLLYGALLLIAVYPFIQIHALIAAGINFLLNIFLIIIEFLSGLFKLPELTINQFQLGVLMILLVFFTLVVLSNKKRHFFVLLSFIVVFLVSSILIKVQRVKQAKIIVHNIPSATAISIVLGQEQYVLTDTSVLRHGWKEMFYLRGSYFQFGTSKHIIATRFNDPIIVHTDQLYLNSAGNKTTIMCGSTTFSVYHNFEFDPVADSSDYLIFPLGCYRFPKKQFDNQVVISKYSIKQNSDSINYYNITTKGSITIDCERKSHSSQKKQEKV